MYNNQTYSLQLDENLEPAYEKMIDRISRLPIPEDLKRDMTDGVDFCKRFSVRNE